MNHLNCNTIHTYEESLLGRAIAMSLALAVLFATGTQAQTRPVEANSAQAAAISKNYGKLPLSFEPNQRPDRC